MSSKIKKRPAARRPAATLRPAGGPRPYSAGPDANDLGSMVTKFTLPVLNDTGYINCTLEDTTGQLERAYGHGGGLRYGDASRGRLRPGERFHIHPCFQRSQWQGIDDDDDWNAILPSVELASRFLDDPAITPFFAGLARDKVKVLGDTILDKTYDWEFLRLDFDKTVLEDKEEQAKMMFAMMAYRKRIVLKFGKLEEHGITDWDKSRKGPTITINEDYKFILREDPGFGAQRWSQPWVPGTDEASARLRTRFLLAVTIVHEFAHCVWKLHHLCAHPEPFVRDHPHNELGYELENMIFSGWIEPSGKKAHLAAPYGLGIIRFPGQVIPEGAYLRGSPQDWGVTWTTYYPVHMGFCKKMFTKKFWDEDVTRYGFLACRPEKKKGVRRHHKNREIPDKLEKGMSPKTLALHRYKKDRRAKVLKAGIEADDTDTSDEEDEDENGFVIRGSHKAALEEARKAAETDQDSDVDMEDAP